MDANKYEKMAEKLTEGEANTGAVKNLAKVMSKEVVPPRYIIEPFISEGLTIFAGKPKIGKTTMIRQVIIAAHNAQELWGRSCKQSKCLFLSLEEGEAMANRKFNKIAQPGQANGIGISFEWARGIDGVSHLGRYLEAHPDTGLVVIDSLSRFRDVQNSKMTQFQQDYEAARALQGLTKHFPGLSIVLIHHTTKQSFEDPMDSISGTYGLTAACDSYAVIGKKGDQYRVHFGGRNWLDEVNDWEFARDSGKWQLVGEWDMDEAGLPRQQKEIVMFLKDGPLKTGEIASRLGVSAPTASYHLRALDEKGLVKNRREGWTLA